jgi:hypothetical protein
MQRKRLIDIRFLDGRNHGLGAWSQVFKGSAAGPSEASTNYVSALDALAPESIRASSFSRVSADVPVDASSTSARHSDMRTSSLAHPVVCYVPPEADRPRFGY